MTTQHTPQHARVIRAAAMIVNRHGETDVPAYSRSYHAKSERAKHFWFVVGRTLFKPYRCQGWTNQQSDTWCEIRAALAKVSSK